jgi:DNA-binding NtrC family response regulator
MERLKRILIVDDEDAILFSYRKLLRGATVKVDDCMTQEEAIALITENNYDAIITDFRLSHSEGSEGLEILKYVKIHKPATSVILMTGYGNDAIKGQALTLGACGYFDKPVQISKIITLLKEMGIHAGES